MVDLTFALLVELTPFDEDVPEKSEWVFGNNIITRISKIKTNHKSLQAKNRFWLSEIHEVI